MSINDISGIEDQVISLYARGMSTRDIHDQIQDLYGIEMSAEMVSKITYIILGVTVDGYKEILSITVGANESSKFWLGMMNDPTNILEAVNRQYQKMTKAKSVFPSDGALEKML